jgi:hypothetical protein
MSGTAHNGPYVGGGIGTDETNYEDWRFALGQSASFRLSVLLSGHTDHPEIHLPVAGEL